MEEAIPTGKVVGQFLFVTQDNQDAGTKPNAVAVTGSVKFTCSATAPVVWGKVNIVPLTHEAEFNAEGLIVPKGLLDQDGLELMGDSPALNPSGFTWTATFALTEVLTGRAVQLPPITFKLSAGETVDLADKVTVGASNGVLVSRGASAYEIAVAQGFVGTAAEWIDSLQVILEPPTPKLTIGTVSEGPAAASITDGVLSLVIPRGADSTVPGPASTVPGPPGPANTLSVGTVTTGAAGSAASAAINGTAPNQTLDLVIPHGNTGNTGPANTLAIGTVTTGAPGSNAAATVTGTAPNQTLNLTLPGGTAGQDGVSPPKANLPFTVRYVAGAWEYTTLAQAKTAGLDEAQTIWFIGGPSVPAWARSGDVFTQF